MFPERFLREKTQTMNQSSFQSLQEAQGRHRHNKNNIQFDQAAQALEDLPVETADAIVGQVAGRQRKKKKSMFISSTFWMYHNKKDQRRLGKLKNPQVGDMKQLRGAKFNTDV